MKSEDELFESNEHFDNSLEWATAYAAEQKGRRRMADKCNG